MKNIVEEQIKKRIRTRWPIGNNHRGKNIISIPSKYLKWVAENYPEKDNFSRAICMVADEEYQYREKTGTHHD